MPDNDNSVAQRNKAKEITGHLASKTEGETVFFFFVFCFFVFNLAIHTQDLLVPSRVWTWASAFVARAWT